MNLRHDTLGRRNDGEERNKEDRSTEDKKKEFGFFKKAAEYIKGTTRVLAIAASATVFAYCGSPGKYQIGDADEMDGQEDTVPDTELDTFEDSDIVEDTIEEDVATDTPIEDIIEEDVVEEDIAEEDIIEEEEPPVPTCFTPPSPIDATTNPLFNNSGSQSVTFDNTGPEAIDADLETNISMTGYSLAVPLGVCPDDPNAVAMVANPDTAIDFEADVSMVAGSSSWSAVIPEVPGIKCPALSSDDEVLISHNDSHQQVPKNADMGGTVTHAGFDIMPVTSTLVAFEKDGVTSPGGILAITGTDFSAPNTIKAHVLDGDVDVEVEIRAGDSSEAHTYTGSIAGLASKEARVYATAGDQMYEVSWDTGGKIWCARCTGHEEFELIIPGDLLCKITDACGCVGDGFDITVLSATIDTTMIPPHLRGLHNVSSPLDSTGTVGVSALSDPADHPSIVVKLEKGSVSWDDGSIAKFDVTVNAELTSKHQNPDGSYDTRLVSVIVRITDPWCWGSLEPTYATRCGGCTPVYD